MGYWAPRVATNIAGTMPLAGKQVQQILVGGPEYGSMTLTRFYTLHIEILPLLLGALHGAHLALYRRHGVTPPEADVTKIGKFYPRSSRGTWGACCPPRHRLRAGAPRARCRSTPPPIRRAIIQRAPSGTSSRCSSC